MCTKIKKSYMDVLSRPCLHSIPSQPGWTIWFTRMWMWNSPVLIRENLEKSIQLMRIHACWVSNGGRKKWDGMMSTRSRGRETEKWATQCVEVSGILDQFVAVVSCFLKKEEEKKQKEGRSRSNNGQF